MATSFIPPRPDQWQGPAQVAGGFTPPPIDSWEGPADNRESIDYSKEAKPTNLQKIGAGALDALKGVGSSVVGTGVGAYNLARKIPGADKVLPPVNDEIQKATVPPDSTMGHVGKFAGDVAQFAAPGGMISKGAKAVEGVTTGFKAAPIINAGARAALEAGSAAGVTGLQTGGDTKAMETAALTAGGASAGLTAAGAGIAAASPTAARMYQSALKPALGGQKGQRVGQIVETGLKEGIPASRSGLDKAGSLIDSINEQVMEGIQARKDAGLTVDLKDVVRRLDGLRARAKLTEDPESYLSAIDDVEKKFIKGHSTTSPMQPIAPMTEEGATGYYPSEPVRQVTTSTEIPIDEAQAIKQHTGTDLRKKYGEMKPYEVEAKKQLVRGLKEEIEKKFPEVKALNAREGKVIDLEGALQKFVNRVGNHLLLSPFTAILALEAAGGAAAGHPAHGAVAAALTAGARMAMENPAIKSQIAIAARRAANSGIPQATATGIKSLGPKAAAAATVKQPPIRLGISGQGGAAVPIDRKQLEAAAIANGQDPELAAESALQNGYRLE